MHRYLKWTEFLQVLEIPGDKNCPFYSSGIEYNGDVIGKVITSEIHSICALMADMADFQVTKIEPVIHSGEIFASTTGTKDIFTV